MPSAVIANVYQVSSGIDLLTANQVLLLGQVSGASSGTVIDDDGTWDQGDDGISTFNGMPVNYLGSGTAQAGISLAGVTIGTGPTVQVVAFEAGGVQYLYYPSGPPPSVVGQIAIVLNITDTPYAGITPLCFAGGTLIRTPSGEVPVDAVCAGTEVSDWHGGTHRVVWTGNLDLSIPVGLSPGFSRSLPVRIPAGALGPGVPESDTLLSQNHRVLVQGAKVEMVTGEAEAFIPAKFLPPGEIGIDRSTRAIRYFHILCEEHVALVANGMPAESLLSCDPAAGLVQEGAHDLLDVPRLADHLVASAHVMTRAEAAAYAS